MAGPAACSGRSRMDPSRSSAAKFAVITIQLSFDDVVGYDPRLEGCYEATQIYHCSRRRSRMAVCCESAGTGADLSSGLLAAEFRAMSTSLFFDELRRRGFIEGQNLTVEYRAYGLHVDLISQYAAELIKARVDVIAASGDETVRAIQQATKTIPIVAIVGDMLGSGLVNLAGATRRQYDRRQYPCRRG